MCVCVCVCVCGRFMSVHNKVIVCVCVCVCSKDSGTLNKKPQLLKTNPLLLLFFFLFFFSSSFSAGLKASYFLVNKPLTNNLLKHTFQNHVFVETLDECGKQTLGTLTQVGT